MQSQRLELENVYDTEKLADRKKQWEASWNLLVDSKTRSEWKKCTIELEIEKQAAQERSAVEQSTTLVEDLQTLRRELDAFNVRLVNAKKKEGTGGSVPVAALTRHAEQMQTVLQGIQKECHGVSMGARQHAKELLQTRFEKNGDEEQPVFE